MQFLSLFLSLFLAPFLFTMLVSAQANGQGLAPPTTIIATPVPIVTVAGSLFVADGTTTATWGPFTQTFASSALGTWAFGTAIKSGTIGLGSIQGTIGVVQTNQKRALEAEETSVPLPLPLPVADLVS